MCVTMTFYYNDSWLGFLAENIVRKSTEKIENECNGCKDGMKSVILHLHYQLSLLEKIKINFECIRAQMLKEIPTYYVTFEKKLPHSDDLVKDKNIYCAVARTFLVTCTAETIYYGRYITEENDSYIEGAFQNKKKKKSCDQTV